MRLAVFNGSPRGKGGNTGILLSHFLKGFTEIRGNESIEYCIKENCDCNVLTQAFLESEYVVFAFPLYIDLVPELFRDFIQSLETKGHRTGNIQLLFLIQSGFSDIQHCRFVHKYCEKMAERIGCRYVGSVVRCSCRGLRFNSEDVDDLMKLHGLGRKFGLTGVLEDITLNPVSNYKADRTVQIRLLSSRRKRQRSLTINRISDRN